MGSVFSPYYAWTGRRDPLNHVALNVALYRRSWAHSRWSLTEHGRSALSRSSDALQIGPSALFIDGDALQVNVFERCFPLPFRLRGKVRILPELRGGEAQLLSANGNHYWWPLAPRARVEVSFDEPAVKWSGAGYLDCNFGDAPLEQSFHDWTWSRAPVGNGAVVLYDVKAKGEPRRTLALRFDRASAPQGLELPPRVRLPSTLFGLRRETHSEAEAGVLRTLTDSHFYARSMIGTTLLGERVVGVHESLSLDRFGTSWAKLLLPFRMPRSA